MADDRFALIGKVHHTLADGVASANLLARLMDLAGSAANDTDDYAVCEEPTTVELLTAAGRDHIAQIAALPRLARDTATGVARLRRRMRKRSHDPELAKIFKTPSTFLNHVVSPARRFATASLALADVKETSKQLGVTFNDIDLATAAGGLRELLLRYDGRADPPLIASVPVSTDLSPDRVTGNEIGALLVALPIHIDDPLERVRLTSLSTARAKKNYELLGPKLQGQMMEYLPPPLTPPMLRWQSKRAAHNRLMNLAVSTVPGPRERGHVGGAPGTEIYSIGVLSPGSAFNMTVWSYVEQVDISILSDDQTFDDIHEATDAMIHGLSEIRSAAGLPPLNTVGTAMAPAPATG